MPSLRKVVSSPSPQVGGQAARPVPFGPASLITAWPSSQIERLVSVTAPGIRASTVVVELQVAPLVVSAVATQGTLQRNGKTEVVPGSGCSLALWLSVICSETSPITLPT